MKKLLFCLAILSSVSAFAGEVRITGAKAEEAFNDLQDQFEYSSGAKIQGLSISTIVRHDNGSISCSKETTQFGEEEASVTFECIIK